MTSAFHNSLLALPIQLYSIAQVSKNLLHRRSSKWKWFIDFAVTYCLVGPYWTHILFTWKSREGLKVYVNGTLNTTDPDGKVFYDYGDPSANLLTGTEGDQTKRYVNGAFDEFIIWERALTPNEIEQYFTAAIGEYVHSYCHKLCSVKMLS